MLFSWVENINVFVNMNSLSVLFTVVVDFIKIMKVLYIILFLLLHIIFVDF